MYATPTPTTSLSTRSRNRQIGAPRATTTIGSSTASWRPQRAADDTSIGARTPYWETLNAPEGVHGVKIPDVTFQQSGTFSTIQRFSVTSNNGLGGFYLGSSEGTPSQGPRSPLIPTSDQWGGSNNTATTYAIGATSGSLATSTNPFDNTASGGTSVSPIALTNAAAICAVGSGFAAELRLVSMAIQVFQTASVTTAKGTIYAATLPGGTHTPNTPWKSETATTLKNNYFVEQYELIPGQVLRIIYAPTDSYGFDYVDCSANMASSQYDFEAHDPAEFYVYWEGANTNDVFNVVLVFNWEYIPSGMGLQVGIGPSLVDYAAMEFAMNHMAELKQISMIEQTLSNGNPEAALLVTEGVVAERGQFGTLFRHTKPITRLPTSTKPGSLGAVNAIFDEQYRKRTSGKSLLERLGDGLITLAEHYAPKIMSMFGF